MNCGRCDYRTDSPDELRGHASDTGHPLCTVCGGRRAPRSLTLYERQTCARCTAQTRADLADIEDLYCRLPTAVHRSAYPQVASGAEKQRGTGADEPMPGGDALSMLLPGTAGSVAGMHKPGTVWHGNREHAADNYSQDAPSVEAALTSWEDDWRHARREPAASGYVGSAVGYLTRNLDWAAQQHPAFTEFTSEVHALRQRLLVVNSMNDQPLHAAAQCFDCGGDLVRRYTDQGLEDDWHCAACERVYDQASYWLAVRSRLEEQEAS